MFQFFLFSSEDFYVTSVVLFSFETFLFVSFSSFLSLLFIFKKIRHDKLLPSTKSIHLRHGIYRTGETMTNLPGHLVLADGETFDQIVRDYFKKGYTYLEILEYLKPFHDIILNNSWFQINCSLVSLTCHILCLVCVSRRVTG